MRIETEVHGAHTILRPRGSFSMGETAKGLAETLDRSEKERAGVVVVDLTGVKSLDSTALGLLVGALRRLHSLNREMMLIHPNDRVALLLSATRLDTMFPIYETMTEAFSALERKTGRVTKSDDRRRDDL